MLQALVNVNIVLELKYWLRLNLIQEFCGVNA